jgi:hypothetical protein
MNHQILDDIYFPNSGSGIGSSDVDINNYNITNIKRLIIDGEVNDDKNASFIVPTLTQSREITIPDRNFELNKSEDLTGSSLPASVVNSSIKNLGIQNANLQMGNNDIKSTKTLYSDSIKISKYRPTYNLSGLVALYDFSDPSELGRDYSVNKNDISITSPVYVETTGSIKHTLNFTQNAENYSKNQYIDLSSISSQLNQTNISINFNIYPTATNASYQDFLYISRGTDSGNYIKLSIFPNTSYIVLSGYVNSVNVFNDLTTSAQMTLNAWNNITFIIGSGGAKIYINGTSRLSNSTAVNLATFNISNFIFGCSNFGGNFAIPLRLTTIHTLSVFSRTLTDTEISSLNAGKYDNHIVILGGQSNMRGSALATGSDLDYTNLLGRVFEYPMSNIDVTTNQIVYSGIAAAQHPLFFNNARYYISGSPASSLWKTFCEYILNYIPARSRIILLPAAKSGSAIEEWVSYEAANSGLVYGNMKAAYNDIISNYPNSKLSAFLWLQGESNAGTTATYGYFLNKLYSNLISDFGLSSSVPFIMGEIRPSTDDKKKINYILKSFSDEKNGKYLVECGSFPYYADDLTFTHYSTESLREIGYLMADKWVRHYSDNFIDRNIYIRGEKIKLTPQDSIGTYDIGQDAKRFSTAYIDNVNTNTLTLNSSDFVIDKVLNNKSKTTPSYGRWLYKNIPDVYDTNAGTFNLKGTCAFSDDGEQNYTLGRKFYLCQFDLLANTGTVNSTTAEMQVVSIDIDYFLSEYDNVSPEFYYSGSGNCNINFIKGRVGNDTAPPDSSPTGFYFHGLVNKKALAYRDQSSFTFYHNNVEDAITKCAIMYSAVTGGADVRRFFLSYDITIRYHGATLYPETTTILNSFNISPTRIDPDFVALNSNLNTIAIPQYNRALAKFVVSSSITTTAAAKTYLLYNSSIQNKYYYSTAPSYTNTTYGIFFPITGTYLVTARVNFTTITGNKYIYLGYDYYRAALTTTDSVIVDSRVNPSINATYKYSVTYSFYVTSKNAGYNITGSSDSIRLFVITEMAESITSANVCVQFVDDITLDYY